MKWAGLALLFIGLSVTAFLVLSDPQGPLHQAFRRYVAFLEHRLRSVFLWTPGSVIVAGQAAGVFLVLLMAALVALPYWYALVALVVFGPSAYLERMRRKRVEEIEGQLDGFITALANALKSTPNLVEAFSSTQRLIAPPLQQEIELAAKELRLGSTLEEALSRMASRIGSRVVDSALSAVLIGRQVGGNLPRILETTAATLREMARLEGVVRTKTAEGKTQLWVLAVFPFGLVLAFSAVKEDYFVPLTGGFIGYSIIAVAVFFWLASLVTARKILNVDF